MVALDSEIVLVCGGAVSPGFNDYLLLYVYKSEIWRTRRASQPSASRQVTQTSALIIPHILLDLIQ
jgi:hypothetical protein